MEYGHFYIEFRIDVLHVFLNKLNVTYGEYVQCSSKDFPQGSVGYFTYSRRFFSRLLESSPWTAIVLRNADWEDW